MVALPYRQIGELDRSLIKGLLPGFPVAFLSLCDFQLSLYLKKGNPRNIASLKDFSRPGITIINREKGNECRIILDRFLKQNQIKAASIQGYDKEAFSHLFVANAVHSGKADVEIGDIAQLDSFPQLDSIPLTKARMVFSASYMEHPAFRALQQAVLSDNFKTSLKHFIGYGDAHIGEIIKM